MKLALLALVAACGDNVVPPVPDAAPPYPAIAATMPRVLTGFGPVMASVTVVPVFFPNDPLRADLLAALDRYATSQAWPATVGEYAVGALTIAAPIDLAIAPPITDSAIKTFAATQPASTTTVYVLLFPDTAAITGPFGASCVDYAGYHYATAQTGGVIYAVIPRCPNRSTLDALFPVISHELVEAATDPVLNGWNGLSEHDFAWAMALRGTELADLCSYLPDHFAPFDVGTPVSRAWSNANAVTFRDPCAPVPAGQGPFFAAIPDAPETATLDLGNGDTRLMAGNKVAVGSTITIPVRLASEAPTPVWTVTAVARDGNGAIDLAFDRDTGKNGDTLALSITAHARPANHAASFLVISTLAGRQTQWAGVVEVTP